MVMKHIKLFENWAEEIEVPEYLDPKVETITALIGKYDPYKILTHTMYSKNKDLLEEKNKIDCNLGHVGSDIRVQFKHFWELENFWRKGGYDSLSINQDFCIPYKLLDFNGIPEVRNNLKIKSTNIKSLRGLENKVFKGNVEITCAYLENLKYCPNANVLNYFTNPLLSYWGCTVASIGDNFKDTLCGNYSYLRTSRTLNDAELNDIRFHATAFCNFRYSVYDSIVHTHSMKINPWLHIHNDPNDVENFEFLFLPFWKNSEMFKEKAREYLGDIDLSRVTRSKENIW
jgi:hypothetical protein